MRTETISSYEQQALDFLTKTNTDFSCKYIGFKKYFPDDEQPRNVFEITLKNTKGEYKFPFGSSIADSCKPTPKLLSNEKVSIYYGVKFTLTSPAMVKPENVFLSATIETDCPTLLKIKNNPSDVELLMFANEGKFTKSYDEFQASIEKAKGKKYRGNAGDFPLNRFIKGFQDRVLKQIEELEKETVLLDKADELIEPSAYDALACITKYDPGTFENFCSDFGYDTDSRKAEKTYNAVREEYLQISRLFTDDELTEMQEIN